ncbi:hypothetical protein [Anaeromyxobacter sp. PSR-1]|uniref:hypothetical protein n=1 Tax=Anaeromyxobacter sp. PSR-1 TaxID=1300915 RepID=UPI0005DFAFEC|nr:hypothetical protein [Anaeromyxobacter sp. PSR-1]GAO01959.1 hypothetical protein PSR1_00824 [Anaeromyxobacter sp. PSR-1]
MAGRVTVNGGWIDAERHLLRVPSELVRETKELVSSEMKAAAGDMLANVSGGVLGTVSGRLAASVKGSARVRQGYTVSGRAGSRYFIGRFWDDGFSRFGRTYRRPWATPVVNARAQAIADNIERLIDRVYTEGGYVR